MTEKEQEKAMPEVQPEVQAEKAVDAGADLATQLDEAQDNYKRALAELENSRRRAEKEKVQLADYAIANFARDLLQVADNLARAQKVALPENLPPEALAQLKALFEGVSLVGDQLAAVFTRHKIAPIEAKGQKFDPNWHEAMVEMVSDTKTPGSVLEVVETGYKIAGRLLRPARVIIAKAPPKPAPSGN